MMKATDLPQNYNAATILEQNLPIRARKPALFSAERTLTFQQAADEANQVGHALQRLGVHQGDIVGILAPDCAEWVTCFFCILKIGAVSLGLNTLLEEAQYDYILNDSRIRVLIVHESCLAKVEPVRDAHGTLAHVIVVGQPQRTTDHLFAEWIVNEATELAAVQTHRDDICSLNYSSGTTGPPKGVPHAHKDYPLTAQHYGIDTLQLQESDRAFAASKLSFTYGISGSLILPWYVGASLVLYAGSPRMVRGVLETIDRFEPTIFYNVPTGYISMLQVPDLTQVYDLSSLRLCVSAGEPLPASVWNSWQARTGLEIYEHIGCTETIVPFLTNSPGNVRAGSSGLPCIGYEVKIVNDQGAPVAPGEIGNLVIKGETTPLFYLHQYEKSRQTFQGEWFRTGDKYCVDNDGFYWHQGRADDLLKVGGNWVSPVEVEQVIGNHPAVAECAVVEARDNAEFVRPKAFIALNNGHEQSQELLGELIERCTRELPAYKRPRWFEFVDALPRTATGKIQRFKLRCN